MIRLNKYLSEAGICSRREADRLIEAGRVTVDGVRAVPGMKVSEEQKICVGKKVIQGAEQKVVENNLKYPDISTAIKMIPGISVIPFTEVSDEGIRDNLKMQIEAMCLKEYNIIKC